MCEGKGREKVNRRNKKKRRVTAKGGEEFQDEELSLEKRRK